MSIETEQDLIGLTRAGRVVALTLQAMRERVRAGVTTAELDAVAAEVFAAHGARSAPQLVYGFPGVTCISLNDEAVHGIPGDRRLRPGDLVKLDVTAELDGYIADAAISVPVPPVRPRTRALVAAAEAALHDALAAVRAGRPLHVSGRAIQRAVERRGFRVLHELCSHGVGRSIHEPPSLPNVYAPNLAGRFTRGLVVTLEPIIAVGGGEVVDDADGWTIRTADGSLSAHVEHTVIIADGAPTIVTALSA
jgi:methionyl aminopeptidase